MSLQDRLNTLRSQLAQAAEVFDEAGYRRRYNLPAGADALHHYLEEGAAAGCEPNPLFVGVYYGEVHNLVFSMARTPLEHFLSEGLANGLSPHPLFDTAFYSQTYSEVDRSSVAAYVHFLRHGLYQDYSPTPLFNPRWYRQSYGYFQAEQVPAFLHYLTSGHRSDNNPNELFDARWYKSIYGPPALAGLDSLSEFVWRGHAASHMPNALFDTWFYRDQYPDVMARGVNALADYIVDGWKNGRFPNALFDGRYYTDRYSDVRDAGVNPLGHYLHYGCRERRDPSGLFSTRFYLSQIPNGTRTIENPLQHYLWEGCTRGLNPHPAFDTAAYRKTHALDYHANPLINYLYHHRKTADHDGPARADSGFVSRELARRGVWADGWCESEVGLSFITSTTAMVSFNLWTTLADQTVRIEVEGEAPQNLALPAEHLLKVQVPIRQARRKTMVRLVFATARSLTDNDPRVAAALVKDVRIDAHAGLKPLRDRPEDGQPAAGVSLGPQVILGDLVWTLRYSRHRGLKSAIKKFAEMRGLRAQAFDRDYYLAQDPFQGTPRTEALRHYVLFGAERNLDPTREFSTSFYLEANEDVRQAGVNPYQHFLKYGRAEGRRSEPSGPTKKKAG